MAKNVKRSWNSPIFTYFKKHNCPNCGNEMSIVKVCRIVNSKSKEAKHYDFSNVDNFMFGDVKFIWDEFYCDNCDLQIPIVDMRSIERAKRKMEKRESKE